MKAKKCDRCGGFYIEELDEFGRLIKRPEHTIFDNNTNTVDLCPSCMKQFETWMKEENYD